MNKTDTETVVRTAKTLVSSGLLEQVVKRLQETEVQSMLATSYSEDEKRKDHHSRYHALADVRYRIEAIANGNT